jgi:hypothetical protein
MLKQQPQLHNTANDSLQSPIGMIHSLQLPGQLPHSKILTGKVFDPLLVDLPKTNSSNSPSMPTTGPQHCINKQPKTTALTDNV